MISLHRAWMLLCGVVGFVGTLAIGYGLMYLIAFVLLGGVAG